MYRILHRELRSNTEVATTYYKRHAERSFENRIGTAD